VRNWGAEPPKPPFRAEAVEAEAMEETEAEAMEETEAEAMEETETETEAVEAWRRWRRGGGGDVEAV
jgi:hypothetical protein